MYIDIPQRNKVFYKNTEYKPCLFEQNGKFSVQMVAVKKGRTFLSKQPKRNIIH